MIPPFTRALVAGAFILAATVGLSGATQADDNIRVAFNFGPPVGHSVHAYPVVRVIEKPCYRQLPPRRVVYEMPYVRRGHGHAYGHVREARVFPSHRAWREATWEPRHGHGW